MSSPLPNASLLENPEERYRIVDRLRSGGTCDLFVVDALRGPHTGRRCVLKTLRAEYRDNDVFSRMLVSEGAILARLDHPNVVRLYGTTLLHGHPWLIIEYVDGVSLGGLLAKCRSRGRALPRAVGYSIFLQLLEALGYIHGARDQDGRPLALRHRDVNPSNLILTWHGQVKLLDFGISQWLHEGEATPEGTIKGTPGYLAPEQVHGGVFTARGDVFSAALVAVMVLGGGRSPFTRDSVNESLLATLHNRRASVHELVPGLPSGVAELLEASLASEPDGRPSASRLAMELLSKLEGSGTGLASRSEVQDFLHTINPERAARASADLVVPVDSEGAGSMGLMLAQELAKLDLPAMPEPVFQAGARLPDPTVRQDRLPSGGGPPPLTVTEMRVTVQDLVDEGVEALLDKDYPAAYEAFSRAGGLDPRHRQVQANLRRLEKLGYGPGGP